MKQVSHLLTAKAKVNLKVLMKMMVCLQLEGKRQLEKMKEQPREVCADSVACDGQQQETEYEHALLPC